MPLGSNLEKQEEIQHFCCLVYHGRTGAIKKKNSNRICLLTLLLPAVCHPEDLCVQSGVPCARAWQGHLNGWFLHTQHHPQPGTAAVSLPPHPAPQGMYLYNASHETSSLELLGGRETRQLLLQEYVSGS